MTYIFNDHKKMFNDITIPELLSYMYCDYPDMAKGSSKYERLKPDIKENIISMYIKEKMSFGRAAELLGIPLHIMMNELAKRKLLRFGN